MDNAESRTFWHRAGELGYDSVYFKSGAVAQRVTARVWSKVLETAAALGVPASARVLELGCGDGRFAATALAGRFARIEAYDVAEGAIARARARGVPNVQFHVADASALDLASLGSFDACFLLGLLHHIKASAPAIVKRLAGVTDRVVVLEPNGDNLVRKLVEFTPRYRAAGEESFRVRELVAMFEAAGFASKSIEHFNFIPDLTPSWLYLPLRLAEPWVERSPLRGRACTAVAAAFERP